jgi:RNA polymerase sigma-70 factor (ECF subfamily)
VTTTLAPDELELYRRELTGYCYRMLGSGFEAEDATQETFVRAWRFADTFEGRSSVRSWLYRIATNVCTDMQRSPQRRARPMELGPSSPPDESKLGSFLPEAVWVSPIADERVLPDSADPAEIAMARESIRLAFVTALQHLPAKQRAVLILCEVLRWQAAEVAQLLDTSVAGVNSALQRARATMSALPAEARPLDVADDNAQLLARYVDAFERYDIESFVTLLHEDVIQSMPPFAARSRRRPRPVGVAGPRDLRRTDQRAQRLPRARPAVRHVRPARPPSRVACSTPPARAVRRAAPRRRTTPCCRRASCSPDAAAPAGRPRRGRGRRTRAPSKRTAPIRQARGP